MNSDLPKTMDELDAWRCPECGEPVATTTMDVIETMKMGKTTHGSQMLTYGIDPGYPHTIEQPVAREYTFTCGNGHSFSRVDGP